MFRIFYAAKDTTLYEAYISTLTLRTESTLYELRCLE
jgi:hypothetical protein